MLSRKEKVGYGLGDLGGNIVSQMITIHLVYFYTDVFLISATTASLIILFTRIIDGISDPLMGYLAEQTKTRWGRYRPYLLFGIIPLAISSVLVFSTPDLSPNMKVLYAFSTYVLFSLTYTFVNVPYISLSSVLTQDFHERSSLTGYRMALAACGGLIGAAATRPLVAQFADEKIGFMCTAIIFVSLTATMLFISFKSVRERPIKTKSRTQVPLKDALGMLLRNRPFWALTFAFVLIMGAVNLSSTMINYYFKYYIENESLIKWAFLVLGGSVISSIPVWVRVSRRLGKRNIYLIGSTISLTALVILFFFKPDQVPFIFITIFFQGIGGGCGLFVVWAMLADTVEYGEWVTGIRAEGIIFGFYGFFTKVAMGSGKVISGLGLDYFGYMPNVPQSEETLWGIRFLMTIAPALLGFIGMFSLLFYNIDEKLHARILKDLQEE